MAKLNLTHQHIYKEVRAFLLGLFPDASRQVVQSIQNNSPPPNGAIVMQQPREHKLDETSTYYDPIKGEAYVHQSIEATMQVDFYGDNAQERSEIVATLWKNYYACEALTLCQPLNVKRLPPAPYINDSNLYEDRFMLDLSLQYNPEITHTQGFVDEVDLTIKPVVLGD